MAANHCVEAIGSSFDFVIALFIYSGVVLVLYSLLQRRTILCQECCFGGYCGLPVPINFIHETKDRWVYCAAFGMLVNLFSVLVVSGVSTGPENSIGDIFQSAIKLFIVMIVLPLYFFALIASIHGPLEPLSHLIGLIYAILSFVAYVIPCATCIHYASDEPQGIEFLGTVTAFQIVSCTPLLLCNGIVLVYFAIKGIYVLILRILKKPLPKQEGYNHCLGYVRRLFRSQPESTNFVCCYKWDPYFKYSVRLLSVFTVIFIALFVWSIQVAFGAMSALHTLKYTIIDSNTMNWTDALEIGYKIALIAGFTVPLISFFLVVIPLMISLTTYRRNCKQLWRGDRSFITYPKQSSAALLTSSAFLFGRQLAMAFWAWIFYIVILFTVVALFATVIILMIFVDSVKSYVIRYVTFTLFTFGLGMVIYFCQYLFVYVVFADKKSVLVDNRRLFHFYTFFFLLYNSVSGLLTTLRRIFTSYVITLFFLPRLDRPLFVGGMVFLDKGYASYLAYIQVEAAYTNPVLNTFIHLLLAQMEAKSFKHITNASSTNVIINASINHYGSTPLMSSDVLCNDVDSLPRRRWYLAYTLLRNPNLIQLRKSFILSSATSL